MTDEQQIRDLIERWATAVHAGDLPAVLADHASDIVMFDVPPPQQGVRGIDAYRDTWPGFFQWQAAGAVFEIESLEVTAGADVAFAFALLRCGTPADFDRDPDQRLRLTIGLRKIDDRWTVMHEHHSFADTTGTPDTLGRLRSGRCTSTGSSAPRRRISTGSWSTSRRTSCPTSTPARSSTSALTKVREVCRRGLEASPGRIEFDIPDLTVRTYGDLAVAWGLDRITADDVEFRSRATRIFQRRDGDWQMTHQHLSVPLSDE